ncbi:MAG TPA: HEAT repeat domain-containing protein [Planctomycetota bacterium]|jgi:HEAT repeat protein|nr:HEAT repeat domain-containing protein [Planctomycetota bacterium]
MKRSRISGSILLLFSLACPPLFAQPQDDEGRKLRDELVKARLENLTLKLRLARLSAKPEEELKILEETLDADLPELVAAAFRELTALPEDRRKEIVPAVLRRFPLARDPYRIEAVAFLGRVPSSDAETTVMKSATDPAPAVRKAVAGALKTASHAGVTETLLILFRDSDSEVRVAALDALGVAKREPAVGPLAATLPIEKDPLILERTVDALGAIGSPAATDALVQLLASTTRETIRWSCINSLGKIGDAKAGPPLLSFLEPIHPLDIRLVTIESLGKLKETSTLPRLADVLRKDPEEKLRQAAASAFGLMAGAGAIEETLLPSYLKEASEPVRRAVWTAMLALAGDAFVANEKLALAFLGTGRRSEADQICSRLHGTKPAGELGVRRVALEESVVREFFEANDYKNALAHCRQLAALLPERADAVRRLAFCQRELKDIDGCLKTLGDLKDPEPLIEEATTQLQGASEERRKLLEPIVRSAVQRLIEPLGAKDEAGRKASLDAVRRLGRRILPSLIADLEDGVRPPGPILEAGAAVTGIPVDPAAAANGAKSTAAAWRAWAEPKSR